MAILDPTGLTQSYFNTPLFLADALTHMEDALRTVGYINRQIEQSRAEWRRGTAINIKKPATFTVQSDVYANMAAIEQAQPEDVQMTIDQYRTSGMRMTDIEEAIVGENAWQMHARRIGYAIASEIEAHVLTLAIKVPHTIQQPLSTVSEDVLIAANRIFVELGVPEDGPQLRRYAADPQSWAKWLKLTAFSQNQGAGQTGVQTQTSGDIPEKYGLTPYQSNYCARVAAPSNAPTGGNETAAIASGASIVSGATKGSKTVVLTYTGLVAPTVFTPGMVVQLATAADGLLGPSAGKLYQRQLYCVETSGAVSGGNISVTFTQALRQDHSGTWRRIVMAASDASHIMNLAYYRDAFALAMVALPGNRPGTNIYTAQNPNSGLTLRAREVYDGISLNNALIFDCWFGAKCIDPDKAIRIPINLNA